MIVFVAVADTAPVAAPPPTPPAAATISESCKPVRALKNGRASSGEPGELVEKVPPALPIYTPCG